MALFAGGFVCAPDAAGQGPYLLGWGQNADLQASPVPTNVVSGVGAFSAVRHHSLAVKNGGVVAWGKNDHGQATVPIQAQSDVAQVAAGGIFSMALRTNGSVLTWGAASIVTNDPGTLGSGVTAIAAGESHALALKNGEVIAWGDGSAGQCTVPVELQSGVTAIAAGHLYSMALKNGAVHVFGVEPGDPYEYGIRSVPPEVADGVTAIAAGTWHALALKDGGVIAWGAAYDGTNSFADATVVPEEAASGVVAISAGDLFSMALKDDGSLVVWGDDAQLQRPVPIFAVGGVSGISAGGGFCLAKCSVLPPRFSGATLPFGFIGVGYAGAVHALGDPEAKFFTSVPWPAWMTLDHDTGAIGGTPVTNGTFTFSVIAANVYGMTTSSFAVTVFAAQNLPPVFVTTSPLPDGIEGKPYSTQIVASNNPVFTLSPEGNPLPQGLTLSTNGLLSGMPTETYSTKFIRVVASNSAGIAIRDFNLTVHPPNEAPVFVTTNPLPAGPVNVPYAAQIVASNNPWFIHLAGAFPSGVTLTSGGMVTGTPTQTGFFTFSVRAQNIVGFVDRVYQFEIYGEPTFSTESPLPSGNVGVAYSSQIVAPGASSFEVSAGALPGGLELSTAGLVSGTPTAAGTFSFTVRATNTYGSAEREFELYVDGTPVFQTASPMPTGTVGIAYNQFIVASGSPTYTNVAGTLPDGLRLLSTGRLFGVPTNSGTFAFTVRATNAYGFADGIYEVTIVTSYVAPNFTLVRAAAGNVRLEWTNPNPVGVEVWRATNLTATPVVWSNFGVQQSPWTNEAAPAPAYYRLRLAQ